ncbi:prepilin-type N-terminal cleavage/methylation domain-containing protein [Photobacterium sp. MCCC 1A19761]|uniref:type IV pilus modification PilV family protein n=1 Tax=Photobacterium sp. MCCC 1A19761 TaxID=3115000 RepID=UPI00307E6B02
MPNKRCPDLGSYPFQRGFTLIEGVIAIVILGIAMITLTSFLFPQAERSAIPFYQARAAAIGQAFLNEILSRKFDEQSDPNNDSVLRCGEAGAVACSVPEDSGRWLRDDVAADGTSPEYFAYLDPVNDTQKGWGLRVPAADDVDDFHGCWGEFTLCGQRYGSNAYPWRGVIDSLLEAEKQHADTYRNMTVRVDVRYEPSLNHGDGATYPHQHKKIEVTVDTGRYGIYIFVALRSNY